MAKFIVQLRSYETRSWGNQAEVDAASATEAAEQAAGEPLLQGEGERGNLRARVWEMPFRTRPEIMFYRAVTLGAGT